MKLSGYFSTSGRIVRNRLQIGRYHSSNVVVLGGCGNFGKLIVERLACESKLKVTAVDKQPALTVRSSVRYVALDVDSDSLEALNPLQPHVVVNAMGNWDSKITEFCAKNGMILSLYLSVYLASLSRMALPRPCSRWILILAFTAS
jgi:hypothetical protein